MGKQAVGELLTKAQEDAQLRDALEAALGHETKPVQTFLQTAAAHGCEFTAQEFVEVMEATEQGGELSEGELDAVAGGASTSWSLPTRTLTLFRSYSTSPSINDLGGLAQSEEEEELLQT